MLASGIGKRSFSLFFMDEADPALRLWLETVLDPPTGIEYSVSQRSEDWYDRAAKQGHLLACYHLGLARTLNVRAAPSLWVASPYLDVAAARGGPILESSIGISIAAFTPLVTDITAVGNRYLVHARPGLEKN